MTPIELGGAARETIPRRTISREIVLGRMGSLPQSYAIFGECRHQIELIIPTVIASVGAYSVNLCYLTYGLFLYCLSCVTQMATNIQNRSWESMTTGVIQFKLGRDSDEIIATQKYKRKWQILPSHVANICPNTLPHPEWNYQKRDKSHKTDHFVPATSRWANMCRV